MVNLFEAFIDSRFWLIFSILVILKYRFIPEKTKRGAWDFVFLAIAAFGLGFWASDSLKLLFKVARPCASLPTCPPDFVFPMPLSELAFTIIRVLVGLTSNCCPDDFGLPSSHATVAFAICGALAGITTQWIYLGAAFVAISRVYLGVHSLVDVVAGSALGMAIAWCITWVYQRRPIIVYDKKSKR